MNGVLVDSNVILDLFLDDPRWADWSQATLSRTAANHALYINPLVYTEVSIGFDRIETLNVALNRAGLQMLTLPQEALFLAGKVFLQYRRSKGPHPSPLPDFFIGAHAAVLKMPLLTRDTRRYQTYFSTVRLIAPDTGG